MSSLWQERNTALLAELAQSPNPDVCAHRIQFYLGDICREHPLTLYEQYTLETEAVSYEHQAWTKPGWPHRCSITDLISVLNMKMMALLFQERKQRRCGIPGAGRRTG